MIFLSSSVNMSVCVVTTTITHVINTYPILPQLDSNAAHTRNEPDSPFLDIIYQPTHQQQLSCWITGSIEPLNAAKEHIALVNEVKSFGLRIGI